MNNRTLPKKQKKNKCPTCMAPTEPQDINCRVCLSDLEKQLQKVRNTYMVKGFGNEFRSYNISGGEHVAVA